MSSNKGLMVQVLRNNRVEMARSLIEKAKAVAELPVNFSTKPVISSADLAALLQRYIHEGDCTNGGVTSRYDYFVLLSDDASHQIFEAREGMPALRIVRRNIGNRVYVHATPVDVPGGDKVMGPCFGGNFITSSDSRFKEITGVDYPIAVHDRWDTAQDWDALTR